MTNNAFYPIGKPRQPWGAQKSRSGARAKSYSADVLRVIDSLRSRFDAVEYGQLDCAPNHYPLLALKITRRAEPAQRMTSFAVEGPPHIFQPR